MTEIDQGIFDAFDSIGAVMAFVHQRCGDEGLRQLMATIEVDQESLEAAAAELETVGFPQVSAIMLEAGAKALLAHVMHCPYAETDIHNYESWQAAYRRRHMLRRA